MSYLENNYSIMIMKDDSVKIDGILENMIRYLSNCETKCKEYKQLITNQEGKLMLEQFETELAKLNTKVKSLTELSKDINGTLFEVKKRNDKLMSFVTIALAEQKKKGEEKEKIVLATQVDCITLSQFIKEEDTSAINSLANAITNNTKFVSINTDTYTVIDFNEGNYVLLGMVCVRVSGDNACCYNSYTRGNCLYPASAGFLRQFEVANVLHGNNIAELDISIIATSDTTINVSIGYQLNSETECFKKIITTVPATFVLKRIDEED